ENSHESRQLVSVRILRHVVDAKLHRAKAYTLRDPAGDDRHGHMHLPQHRDAEPVLDLVALELEATPIDVAEIDPAVGHDAVDVEGDEANGLRKRRVDHRRTRSQMSIVRATRSSSCPSGIMFGPSLGALSGSGCVSMKRPSAPAATAASASGGMNSRAPPLAPPVPCPGRCTLCVASKITGASQAARRRANERISTTRSP